MTIKSFKDAAYQAAVAVDAIVEAANYVKSQCATFVEDQPKDILEQLDEGWMLRYNEKHPSKYYAYIDKNLVQVDKPTGKTATKEIGIYQAMAFSQQAYGQMRHTDPLLHKIIGEWRTKWSKYRKNRLTDLINKMKEDTKTEKAAVDAFAKWVSDKVFPGMVTRNKTSKARGDETAMPDDLLKRKIAAFHAAK